MKLICYPTGAVPPRLRPAPVDRDWMDRTPSGFAYRCLPLNIANTHGWEILSPCRFSARWDGGAARESIRIDSDAAEYFRPLSHFGSGVLTFHVTALFRTPPGINLWVGGPINRPKDGIAALSGIIESDWSPYPFTMNWLFTRPGAEVVFEDGEPFCSFFPVARDLVEMAEPEIRPLDSDPELAAQLRQWSESRARFLVDLPVEGSAAQAEKWQKGYYRGMLPDGNPGSPEHRIKLRLNNFVTPEPPTEAVAADPSTEAAPEPTE